MSGQAFQQAVALRLGYGTSAGVVFLFWLVLSSVSNMPWQILIAVNMAWPPFAGQIIMLSYRAVPVQGGQG